MLNLQPHTVVITSLLTITSDSVLDDSDDRNARKIVYYKKKLDHIPVAA